MSHSLTESFESHRMLLWRLCYRMTGCAADADDLVQETFARALERPPADEDRALRPWLVQVALNLSRDHLRRRKRAPYAGPWLPSPIETEGFDRAPLPDARYSELESVSKAFLVALEALSASQRAVLILRDVLGYSVEEAAAALALSEANVKTTHHRARAALERYDHERARVPLDAALQCKTRDALHNLMWHLMTGNTAALEALLADDVRALNDGDGKYLAARSPVLGREKVALFHLNTRRALAPMFAVREINGLPGLVAWWPADARERRKQLAPRAVCTLELDTQGKIRALDTVVAPRKLTHVRFALSERPARPRVVAALRTRIRTWLGV